MLSSASNTYPSPRGNSTDLRWCISHGRRTEWRLRECIVYVHENWLMNGCRPAALATARASFSTGPSVAGTRYSRALEGTARRCTRNPTMTRCPGEASLSGSIAPACSGTPRWPRSVRDDIAVLAPFVRAESSSCLVARPQVLRNGINVLRHISYPVYIRTVWMGREESERCWTGWTMS